MKDFNRLDFLEAIEASLLDLRLLGKKNKA